MSILLTCPHGHQFEPGPGTSAVCPHCGTVMNSSASSDDGTDTFKPTDEMPPLPTPSLENAKGRAPFQLTGYEILEVLGRGGMGIVYKARQISLDRPVALKMILGNPSPEELARFKTEADACAQLHHPNIVQIHEIGERDGQPFLALEFIEGGSLAAHLAGAPAPPRAAAQLVEMLARAIHFAHGRMIIHRDLKPANILLAGAVSTESPLAKDDWPAAIQPKIADFGLAKRLDRDVGQTRSGSILGTPSYMAPEQASGTGADALGPATDVYALGAILYEMLTGRPPFRGVTALETVRQVMQDEPVPPRRLQPIVPLDAETICLKCLAKEPGQRYASAAALADDLARFLAGQPILARPTNWHERSIKWIKRRPALAGLIGSLIAAALLLVGLSVGLYYNSLLQRSLDETEQQRALAERYQYIGDMNLAQRDWRENEVPQLLSRLKAYPRVAPGQRDLRGFEWHYLLGLCHGELLTFSEHGQPVTSVAYSPTEELVASASRDEIRLWEPGSGKLRRILKGHTRDVNSIAFSGDGKLLGSASSDKSVRIWNIATGDTALQLPAHEAAVTCVAFHPTEHLLACGSRVRDERFTPTLFLWNTTTGQKVRTLQKHREPILSVAFSPDGKRLLSGGGDVRKPDAGEFWLWDVATGEAIAGFQRQANAVAAVAFNPKGDMFATAGDDRAVRIWQGTKPSEARVLTGHRERVTALAFDKSGTRLASGSLDRSVLVWNPGSGDKPLSRQGHLDGVRGVAFSTDSTRLVSAGNDGAVKVWSAAGDQEFASLLGHADFATDAAFSPDGRALATASLDRTVCIWNADHRTKRVAFGAQAAVHCVAFPFDIDQTDRRWHLITGGDDETIRFYNVAAEKEVDHVKAPGVQIRALAVTHDGSVVAYSGIANKNDDAPADISLWDTRASQNVGVMRGHSRHVTSLAFSPNGQRLASAGGDVKIWDVKTRTELASIAVENAARPRVVFSGDGRRIAIANGDLDKGRVRIHDAATGAELLVLTGQSGMASALAFSPDGERLASTDGKLGAGRVKLWDAQTGQEVLTLRGATGVVQALTFSTDGRRVAAAGGAIVQQTGEVILWDARPHGGQVKK